MQNTLVLDIGGTAIKSGMVSPDGKLLEFAERDANATYGAEYLMKRVCEIISEYHDYGSIGMSVTGQINSETGVVVFATQSIPKFTNTPVRKMVEERFKVRVTVENDVNCAALGEGFYGAAQDKQDFLCLTYGTGVGGAIVINRNIYHGASFSAGEFGHFTTRVGGLDCSCGRKGCYEAYASTRALSRRVFEATGTHQNGREVFSAISNGDHQILEIVDRWIDEITYGLSSLIHIFNPPCIVLGGGIMNENYVINEVRQRLYDQIMPSYRCVELRQAQLGNRAGLMGAYHLASTIL